MEIMPLRQDLIECNVQGYDAYTVHFVLFCDGIIKGNQWDDLGLYYFVTLLHSLLGLEPVLATNVFLYGLIAVSIIVGWSGAIIAFPQFLQRAFITIGFSLLALAMVLSHHGIYVAQSAIVVGCIPWIVFLYKNAERISIPIFLLAFFSFGFVASIANFIRLHSGTTIILFLGFLLVVAKTPSRYFRMAAIACVIVGFTVPLLYGNLLFERRDAFLQSNNPSYSPPLNQHLFWIVAYGGLGFTPNNFDVEWGDHHVLKVLSKWAPGMQYFTVESERVFRQKFFEIVFEHPVFFIINITAKLGVLLFFTVAFANIGLLVRGSCGLDKPLRVAFLISAVFSAANCIIAIPTINYMTGLIAISSLYGIFSVASVIPTGLKTSFLWSPGDCQETENRL